MSKLASLLHILPNLSPCPNLCSFSLFPVAKSYHLLRTFLNRNHSGTKYLVTYEILLMPFQFVLQDKSSAYKRVNTLTTSGQWLGTLGRCFLVVAPSIEGAGRTPNTSLKYLN